MLTINISELVLTIASFFLLMFVLKKLLFQPLLSFMEARQARIDEGLKLGDEAEARLHEARSESDRLLDEAKKQAARRVADEGLRDRERIAEAAKLLGQRAESASEAALREVEAARERRRAELAEKSPQLTELLARRLLGL